MVLYALLGPGVLKKLHYRFNRQKHSETAIEDVYDGRLYKKLSVNNGFLSSPDNISLLDLLGLILSNTMATLDAAQVLNLENN